MNLHESMPGIGANIKGELVKVDLGRINIAQGKKNRKEFEIPFQNIKRANRVWDFEVRKIEIEGSSYGVRIRSCH
ncbi:hypothetical protein EBQ74_08625 [bacterium]|nr:hypothetical protein [bacterium]